jgi:metal-sulfur cluster biosynthetic enzyme
MMGIVDIGLVYEVDVDAEGNVKATYSLTSMGCPAGPHIASEIDRAIREVPGVGEVEAALVWSPPWTPDRMSEDAKFALGFSIAAAQEPGGSRATSLKSCAVSPIAVARPGGLAYSLPE